ncbi:MAG: FAD-dependent oxidoreductase [Pyrinomonadaceae bacterium]
MNYEVVVVGAGIGGLTLAALLAARGVGVCVLERESRVGGCAATFERFNYRFESGAGLYAGWQPEGIHARIFAELPIAPPTVRRLTPAYVVRLPDETEVRVGVESAEEFHDELRRAFPECAETTIAFYREIGPLADALRRSVRRAPALATLSKIQRMTLLAAEMRAASRILALERQTVTPLLAGTSFRFRRFIDAQLQIFAGRASDECAALYAVVALTEPQHGLYAIHGGAEALTNALAESIKKTGGTIRLDTTALRLVYDASGQRVAGVTLLSGETVTATRAVVSNLTVWDTFGKLVGLNRTPSEVRAHLKDLRGWGAYLLYLGMDEETAQHLPGRQLLALRDWQEGQAYDPESAQFMLSVSPAGDGLRAPAGKRAVIASFFTDAADWFAYHEDESEHETQDQLMLEKCWERLHAALPELRGANIEVIETATPHTFYEQTRRKLGMVGGVGQPLDVFGTRAFTHRTPLPNLYMVGDTVFPGNGIAAVTHSALIAANEIAPPR